MRSNAGVDARSVAGDFTAYFPRALVINLPERADRRTELRSEFDRFGLALRPGTWEFLEAVRPREAEGFPSIGARGCFLSHLAAIERAVLEGQPRILVMEDDLVLHSTFGRHAANAVEELAKQPWDVALLGTCEPPASDSGHRMELVPATPIGAHFYAINGPALEEFRDFLRQVLKRPPGHPEGGPMHFDGAICHFVTSRERQAFVSQPSLGGQRSSRSDIAEPSWFDRVNWLSPAVSVARRLWRSTLRR